MKRHKLLQGLIQAARAFAVATECTAGMEESVWSSTMDTLVTALSLLMMGPSVQMVTSDFL